jgi:hypothetical protein
MRGDGINEMRPQRRGAVVAHVLGQEEPAAGNQLGGPPAPAGVDEGVVETVDDERGDLKGRECLGAGTVARMIAASCRGTPAG